MKKTVLNEYSVARGPSKNEVFYFDSRFFTVDGVRFEIIGTQTIDKQVVHTVVRTGAKRRKKRKRDRLLKHGIDFKKRSYMKLDKLVALFKEGRLNG